MSSLGSMVEKRHHLHAAQVLQEQIREARLRELPQRALQRPHHGVEGREVEVHLAAKRSPTDPRRCHSSGLTGCQKGKF